MIARLVDDLGPAAPGSPGVRHPLVYLPGIDGTGLLLLGLGERLRQRFRLLRLRYETAGPRPAGGDRYEDLARSVDAVLEARAAGRVLLLTESFGGAVALALALEFPERVAGLAIVNGFARFHGKGRLVLARCLAPLLPDPLFQIGRSVLAPMGLFGARRDERALADFRALRGARFDAAYRRRLAMIRRVDLLPRLGEVRSPVFLYASDRDRVVDAVPAAREMLAALPDGRLTILERAGHLVLPLREEPWLERLVELEAAARRSG